MGTVIVERVEGIDWGGYWGGVGGVYWWEDSWGVSGEVFVGGFVGSFVGSICGSICGGYLGHTRRDVWRANWWRHDKISTAGVPRGVTKGKGPRRLHRALLPRMLAHH